MHRPARIDSWRFTRDDALELAKGRLPRFFQWRPSEAGQGEIARRLLYAGENTVRYRTDLPIGAALAAIQRRAEGMMPTNPT
jgi:hypothetical protein